VAESAGTTVALTRERVVDAALALVERDGLSELSMRRLAAELGAGTMSLYNHVADKEDLFDAMAEHVLADVRVADSDDWQEIVALWASDSRQVLLDRIALIPLVVAPQRLNLLGGLGRAVGVAMTRAGLEPTEATMVVRVVARYFAGAVLLDAPRVRLGDVPRPALDATFTAGLDALLRGLADEVAR
jgi:AcrR family transcriptional regulator